MQNRNRVYDKDLRRFIYPQQQKYEREPTSSMKSPISKRYSFNEKNNNCLYYQYNKTPSGNYFQNRELNQNALGYPRDQGQFSGQGNKCCPFSYINNTHKPETKIYHYSISSKREYDNQDYEKNTNTGVQRTKCCPNLNIDTRTYYIDSNNRYNKFLNRRKEVNILPTKVFITDTYQYNNKENPYKFRPSREKDGYKGGVINLERNSQYNKYSSEDYLKKIILIQKWWKKMLNNKNTNYINNIRYERYSSYDRKSISRNDSFNNNKGSKYIVQTTRVEVIKRPYMSIPLIKPEIITKENKVNINMNKRSIEENLEIVLDKDSLKRNMINIWNEDNMNNFIESFCILPNRRENKFKSGNIKVYEDEINKLKLLLKQKEKELNDLSNKLKNNQNKKDLNTKNMTRQLVDNLFINNNDLNTINTLYQQHSSIETNENFEILPLEREPLKKQLIDSLFIENNGDQIFNYNIYNFPNDKTIIEPGENIHLIPSEKEPLQKQCIDDLFIKREILTKPENLIQNIDKIFITETIKPENSIEPCESFLIYEIEKEPLQEQSIDTFHIDKFKTIKPENKFKQNERFSLIKIKRPKNIIENINSIGIFYEEEEKILEEQLVDDFFIEKSLIIKPMDIQDIDRLTLEEKIKPDNALQNVDKIFIPEITKEMNLIEAIDIIEINSLEREPLENQFVEELFIEKTPYVHNFKNMMIEGFEGMTILKKEKEDLLYQQIDSVIIDSLEPKKNEIQKTELMTILRKPKPKNSINNSDSIFIPPKIKEPLKIQNTDKLFIEKNTKPENIIQNIDKLELKETIKNPLIEGRDSIHLKPKPKDELILQKTDSINIEQMAKPENEINSIDKFVILKNPKPKLLIEENNSIFIPQKEKPNLECNSIDNLVIEAISHPENNIQSIDKITLIEKEKYKNEISENTELYIPSKEKEKLLNQNIDNIYIDSLPKIENKIQLIDKILIEEIKRPDNIIEADNYIIIPGKERPELQNQTIDSIIIKPIEKKENIIQSLDKFEFNEINRPLNLIEKSEDIFIPSNEKSPYELQSVDNLLIEGISEGSKRIQRIEQFTILKNFRLSYRINKMDNIYIPRKEKCPLSSQTVDSLFIDEEEEINNHHGFYNNEIQAMDKINILKVPKPENKIEKNDEFNILKSLNNKKVLLIQSLGYLMIEKEPRKYYISQGIDKIEIHEIQKEFNYAEIPNESICILGNKKILENKEESVDSIFIDKLEKEIDYKIENVEKLDILKNIKKQENNIIETQDYIFIPPKEKEKENLSQKLVDSIYIENNPYPENISQSIDKIEISHESKPIIQKIENIESIYLSPKQKEPFDIRQNDNILIEGIELPETKIENIDKIQISLDKKFLKEDTSIEDGEKINIEGIKKPEIELKNENIDSILFEGKNKDNEIQLQLKKQLTDEINLLEIKKPEIMIENILELNIEPLKRDELENQKCDNLFVEGETPPENEIQKVEYIEILKTEKSFIHEIEPIEFLYIPPNIKPPLINEIINSITIEETINQENKDAIYSIEQNTSLLIKSGKEKIDLLSQSVDVLIIEGNNLPKNEIQKLEILNITPTKKNFVQIIDESVNFEIKGIIKENKELKYFNTNNILIEGINKFETNTQIELKDEIQLLENKRPENNIEQNINIFIEPKTKESPKEKNILEYQLIDRMFITGLDPTLNEFQHAMHLTIEKMEKNIDIIPESDINLFIKAKEKEILQKQLIDSLFIDKINKEKEKEEKKMENIIENSDKFIIMAKPREKNDVEITCNLFIESIKPKEKKELELQNVDKFFIEKLKPLLFNENKCNKETINSFNLLGELKKEQSTTKPLLVNNNLSINNTELFIKGSHLLLPSKKNAENKIQRTEEVNIISINKINEEDINPSDLKENKDNLRGKNKLEQIKPKKEKDEFVKDRMDSLFFSGTEKIKDKEEKDNIKPKDKAFINLIESKGTEFIINKEENSKIAPQNIIVSPEKEISQDKIYLLFLDQWKKDKIKQQIIIRFNLEGKKEKEKEKEKSTKVINLSITKPEHLILEGNITHEYYQELLFYKSKYIKQKGKIQLQPESNNSIQKSDSKSLENKNMLTITNPYSLNLEGNISSEYYQELILIKTKYLSYLSKKEQIQPQSEVINIFIPKDQNINNIFPDKFQKNEIIPVYSDSTKIQLWIKGKQKKPYIIENKGYFIINSIYNNVDRSSRNNLIVRGTSFGFMPKAKKPGPVSQDFVINDKEKNNKTWNIYNKLQRSQFFNINGIDNKITWKKGLKRQRCVKFDIPPSKALNYELLLSKEQSYFTLYGLKDIKQEISQDDYNYNSLEAEKNEKNNKNKGVVKSTIARIYREPELDNSQEEFDPFSCCKKRDTTKYDNLFKERKTVSVKMKDNNNINNNNLIIRPENINNEINIIKDDYENKFMDNKERKSDINLIENKKKNKLKLINKDNNVNRKPNTLFKKKEKKMEYLRELGAQKPFYN